MSNLTRDFIYQKMIDVFSDKEINFQEAMELINSADLISSLIVQIKLR